VIEKVLIILVRYNLYNPSLMLISQFLLFLKQWLMYDKLLLIVRFLLHKHLLLSFILYITEWLNLTYINLHFSLIIFGLINNDISQLILPELTKLIWCCGHNIKLLFFFYILLIDGAKMLYNIHSYPLTLNNLLLVLYNKNIIIWHLNWRW